MNDRDLTLLADHLRCNDTDVFPLSRSKLLLTEAHPIKSSVTVYNTAMTDERVRRAIHVVENGMRVRFENLLWEQVKSQPIKKKNYLQLFFNQDPILCSPEFAESYKKTLHAGIPNLHTTHHLGVGQIWNLTQDEMLIRVSGLCSETNRACKYEVVDNTVTFYLSSEIQFAHFNAELIEFVPDALAGGVLV